MIMYDYAHNAKHPYIFSDWSNDKEAHIKIVFCWMQLSYKIQQTQELNIIMMLIFPNYMQTPKILKYKIKLLHLSSHFKILLPSVLAN